MIYARNRQNFELTHELLTIMCPSTISIRQPPTSPGIYYDALISSKSLVHENREKIKCRKSATLVSKSNEDEADHDAVLGQIMKIYGSDGESNRSQEASVSLKTSKGAVNPNSSCKKKASRESATDPQSVYARKRRERINERLRTLQKLVPNGTKVDISTMLEEAVQYVKFLQLQIKLLSSDDLWMYAPIAYNGMDIGFDLTGPSPR